MVETRNHHPPSEETTVCQLARLGDLAQTLPLLRTLVPDHHVTLICDCASAAWAELLPGVSAVRGLDSRDWRRRSTGALEDFPRVLADLNLEPAADGCFHSGRFLALNDHPVADALAALSCRSDAGLWWTPDLLLVRTYVRLMALERRLNRLHLADLWASRSGRGEIAASEPVIAPALGTQFAKLVLTGLRSRKNGGIWTFILGSGANCRRLEPEIFAGWWRALPPDSRPAAVLTGSSKETELAARFRRAAGDAPGIVDLAGRCSPGELLGVFAASDLVIGVDTGPLHWAAAVGTQVVGLYFAEAGLHDTGPYGEGHWALAPDCPDYPCAPGRAAACAWRCRDAYNDALSMANLLTALASGPPASPTGITVYRSRWTPQGNRYRRLASTVEVPAVAAFERLARRALGLCRAEEEELYHHTLKEFDVVERWVRMWGDLIMRHPRPAGVPIAEMEKAQREARQRLGRVWEACLAAGPARQTVASLGQG